MILDSAKVINADTKIEDVPIKTVVIGEAYIERAKTRRKGKGPSVAILPQMRGHSGTFGARGG
jgi:hypothetical protein